MNGEEKALLHISKKQEATDKLVDDIVVKEIPELKDRILIVEQMAPLNGEQGEKGIQGEQGAKGDTGDMGEAGDKGDKGERGFKGIDGKNGKDGKPGIPGKDGIDGVDGRDGKDGSPDTPKKIRDKLRTLKGKERLSYKDLKDIPKDDWRKSMGSRDYEFLELTDTPKSYAGMAGKAVYVKADEKGLEFVTDPVVVTNHAALMNLDYAHAGHTGFQPAGAYLTDAPSDGSQYCRKNGTWAVIVAGGGMVYPGTGIAVSTGSAWNTSINGTAGQFVKGDGSLDSTTYITALTDTLNSVLSRGNTSLLALTAGGIRSGSIGVTGQYSMYSHISPGVDWIVSINPNLATSANADFYLPPAHPAGTYLLNMTTAGVIGYDSTAYITLLSLSSSATGLTYTNTTGAFSLTSGYVIPTTTEESNWNQAYTDDTNRIYYSFLS